jgi:hypothetical protein
LHTDAFKFCQRGHIGLGLGRNRGLFFVHVL